MYYSMAQAIILANLLFSLFILALIATPRIINAVKANWEAVATGSAAALTLGYIVYGYTLLGGAL